jgi:asparagine synthase (glutamine-hydrolysing)
MRAAAEARGWSTLWLATGLWVAGGGPRIPKLQRLHDGRLLIVGDIRLEGGAVPAQPGRSPEVRCRQLSTDGWGRYVALVLSPSGTLEALFRDPSGALDCVVWRQAGLLLAGSILPDWLGQSFPPSFSVNWEGLADILADPILVSAAPPLQGVEALAPGEVRQARAAAPGGLVWSPAQASRSVDLETVVKSDPLRTALDSSILAATEGASSVLVEVSGGLDSAIVASSFNAVRPGARASWRNSWGPYAEADERRYARAVADRLGASLDFAARPPPVGAEALCFRHPRAFRPSLNLLDRAYDEDQAAACAAAGADMILTGKGGDVAFFQTATSAVLADLVASKGLRALADSTAFVLARRQRRSVWSVMMRAVRVQGRPLRRSALSLAAPEVRHRRPLPHPWLADLDGLPLGKRIQIAGFTHNLALHGLSRRTEAADLVHPLLSQPVMEVCLALPTYRLTLGGHDRLLARNTFADRLPELILRRRSKGELGAYYGRAVAGALEPLRTHLLEGRLAGAGLLDLEAVEAALQLDQLIWHGDYGAVMLLALLESWAQAWA